MRRPASGLVERDLIELVSACAEVFCPGHFSFLILVYYHQTGNVIMAKKLVLKNR